MAVNPRRRSNKHVRPVNTELLRSAGRPGRALFELTIRFLYRPRKCHRCRVCGCRRWRLQNPRGSGHWHRLTFGLQQAQGPGAQISAIVIYDGWLHTWELLIHSWIDCVRPRCLTAARLPAAAAGAHAFLRAVVRIGAAALARQLFLGFFPAYQSTVSVSSAVGLGATVA